MIYDKNSGSDQNCSNDNGCGRPHVRQYGAQTAPLSFVEMVLCEAAPAAKGEAVRRGATPSNSRTLSKSIFQEEGWVSEERWCAGVYLG
jgi:hypothetical protein